MWPIPRGVRIRGDDVRRVLQLRIVDRLGDAGLPISKIWAAEALDVDRAARQAALGQQLGRRGASMPGPAPPQAPAAAGRVLDIGSAAAHSRRPRCRPRRGHRAAPRRQPRATRRAAAPSSAWRRVRFRVRMRSVSMSASGRGHQVGSWKIMPVSRGQPSVTSSPSIGGRSAGMVGQVDNQPIGGARAAHAIPATGRDRRGIRSSRPGGWQHPAPGPAGSPPAAARASPGRYRAPRGRRSRSRRRLEPAGGDDAAGQEGAAANEAGDEAVGRALVEVALRADLADFALRHHHQAVGDGQRLLLVVRHHDGGQAELALQLADLHPHLLPQLGVEVRQRLVQQQHVGPDGQRPGQRHALLLAAGELPRQAVREPIQPHQAQGLARAPRARPSAPSASRARRRRCRRPSCAGTTRSSGTPCRYCAARPGGG